MLIDILIKTSPIKKKHRFFLNGRKPNSLFFLGAQVELEHGKWSKRQDRPVLAMDPWIVAFPFDPPDLAKRKFDFCQQHRDVGE